MRLVNVIEPLESRIAPAFAAHFDVGGLNGRNGFEIAGVNAHDLAGFSVSDAGDINGDGFGDLLVGSFGADLLGPVNGAAYVVFGRATKFKASIDLASLDGENGFSITSSAVSNFLGYSVSAAGDINGDGFHDVIVGASAAGGGHGAAYVIFGKPASFAPNFDLDTLDGTNGFKMSGPDARVGTSVGCAGDINGDNIDDVIIGAERALIDGIGNGGAFVVFGSTAGFSAEVGLLDLDGTNGFAVQGEAVSRNTGRSVSGAGDVNGDGIADFIIGSPRTLLGSSAPGAAYVVFGRTVPFSNVVRLSELDGDNGFKVQGLTDRGETGHSVGNAGDINGDGLDDIVIGAPGGIGDAYVVFGKAGGFAGTLEVSALNGSNGFTLKGTSFDNIGAGSSVSGIGDFNGDGLDDLLIGARDGGSAATSSGAAYVIFGKSSAFSADLLLSTLDGLLGFKIEGGASGDSAGESVSAAGDVNGDGFPDVIIGAPTADSDGKDSGVARVIFGGDPGRLRIAPDRHSATYTDPDGDKVTVQSSNGMFTPLIFDMRFERLGFQLEKLELTDPAFSGSMVVFSASRHDANKDGMLDGNGKVDVGHFNATGVDLRSLTISGDLGQIDIGDNDPVKPALKALHVRSLGARALTTQDPVAPSLHSHFAGDLKSLTVKQGITNGVTVFVGGRIGTATIGGDVDGSTISTLGALTPPTAEDAIALAKLTIGGNLTGSRILAGYDLTGSPANADVSIGKVRVVGNWSASDLVAGIIDSTNDGFGRNDTVISGGAASIIAQIAKIIIKGAGSGSAGPGEFFGITAESVQNAKVGGTAVILTEGKDDLLLDQTNGNFRLVEI
jgi:hypothetical protein